MYGYVISQGQIPDCIKAPAKDYTDDFLASIQKEGITEKKQLLLLQLRSQTKELLSLGVNPADTDNMLASIGEFRSHYDTLDAGRAQLSGEYKSLLTLRQHLTYCLRIFLADSITLLRLSSLKYFSVSLFILVILLHI